MTLAGISTSQEAGVSKQTDSLLAGLEHVAVLYPLQERERSATSSQLSKRRGTQDPAHKTDGRHDSPTNSGHTSRDSPP